MRLRWPPACTRRGARQRRRGRRVGCSMSETALFDVPQECSGAGSFEVRDELQEFVVRDLLGPWDGPEEHFAPRARGPRDRYLVGMLGPKRSPRSVVEA